jgi:hypothetical protein
MAEGTVKYQGELTGYTVVIEHALAPGDSAGSFVSTVYYHMRLPRDGGIQLQTNQSVVPTQPIGYISDKPKDYDNSVPHLHFGIRSGAFRSGIDPRTERWFYPGYTTIYANNAQGKSLVQQCNSTDPTHLQIVAEWIPPLEFVSSRESPLLSIATDSCKASFSCVGVQQSDKFIFDGVGFTPGGEVKRYLDVGGIQTELPPPRFSADADGHISWSFIPSCSDMPGTIGVFAIDSTTGKQSNAVTETITPGTCGAPTPGIRVSPSPFDFGTVNIGSSAREVFTISNPGIAT